MAFDLSTFRRLIGIFAERQNLRLVSLQYGQKDKETEAESRNAARLETIPDLDQVEI